MSKILCFGDSITWGAWDSEGGWVARVRKSIDKVCINSSLSTFVLTYNLGISSDTSERVLHRFDSEINAYTIEEGAPRIIISLGTNDAIWLPKKSSHMVELGDFENNLIALIQKAKVVTNDIVFLGNMPIDENKTQPYLDAPDIVSKNQDIRTYDQVTAKVCKANNIGYIAVFDELYAQDYLEMLFTDGVHPNDKGHDYLSRKVFDYIMVNNWIQT